MKVIPASYGLLGEHLAHSWSPEIHALLGADSYALIEAAFDEVDDVFTSQNWKGLNVTIPYKQKALLSANVASEAARTIGAANTLVRYGNTVFAENTDAMGFYWLLERFARFTTGLSANDFLNKKTVLVLGATGGAGRAVSYLCTKLGAHVVGMSRSTSLFSRHTLCNDWITYQDLTENPVPGCSRHVFLIVNCTPVGMYPACPKSPLPHDMLTSFPKLSGVIDLIYNPLRSGLILEAQRCGVATENGLGMLVAQAYAAHMLFQAPNAPARATRTTIDLQRMDSKKIEAIESTLAQKMQNIVLIGMPGVGKTSTAVELSKLCGRPCIDIDVAIHDETGKTSSEILRAYGETYFRDIESKITRRVGSKTGSIIACGGGVVVRDVNYDYLKQNGHLVFLDRPIEGLSVKDRPLSALYDLKEIAQKRMPLYRAWKDTYFTCTGSPLTDARALKSLFLL